MALAREAANQYLVTPGAMRIMMQPCTQLITQKGRKEMFFGDSRWPVLPVAS